MTGALHTKLLRDLFRLKGQVVTIALVVACGIATFVTLRGNYAALVRARASFYETQQLGDVFASLERAPDSAKEQIEAIDGVSKVETRIVRPAMVPLGGRAEPAWARIVSLPAEGTEALNVPRVVDGRRPEPGRSDEALLLESFAKEQQVRPGDRLDIVLDGQRRTLRIVGIVVSPEYVLAVGGASMTADPARFAVVWMDRVAVAAAFDRQGTFDDVAISLQPGASEAGVIAAVDRQLARFGGMGAYARQRQPSERMLSATLSQLDGMSTVVPAIFLCVAALLVHVVLSRLVHLQRSEIATLEALGYSGVRIGLHFLELVLVVCGLGTALGVALGGWLGSAMVELYARWFHLPELGFRLDARDALVAAGISFAAASGGAFSAVRSAARLPPAEAMQPPSPQRYSRSIVDRLGLGALLGPAAQMVVRELERRPLRSLLSAGAIATATALSVIAGWYYDGIEVLMSTHFHEVMREDAVVTFVAPRPERAVRELSHLPGVLAAEPLRIVPVRFRSAQRYRDAAITGYPDAGELRGLRDRHARPVSLPVDGVVLTDMLAEILGVGVGDTVDIDVKDGARKHFSTTVTGLVDESMGMQGHVRLATLRHWLGEAPTASLALLRLDPAASADLDRRLSAMPFVASVERRASMLTRFREQSGSMIVTISVIIALFAACITIGVVYNDLRVALSTRARDLASLRVLGFTRGELSGVLLGEQALRVLLALPFGLLLGRWLINLLATTKDPESFRMPVVLTPRSYAFAALVTLAAAVLSALPVRRLLARLDLVAVLKTRE